MTEHFDNAELRELSVLVTQSLEGSISREGISRMEELLESGVQMRAYYRAYLSLYCDLNSLLDSQLPEIYDAESANDELLWEILAQHEKAAPTLVINDPDTRAQCELIQKVERPKVVREFSRFSLISIITSLAALVFLVIFARFAPVRSGIEVATVFDSVDAKWADWGGSVKIGDRLTTGTTPWLLRSGYVQVLFDNDTQVVIEGPAEFNLLTGDQLMLHYGRAYATVPEQAYGFMVCTPNGRIIDLGTEFGVQAEIHGDVKLHVIDGRTNFVSNIKGSRINQEVKKGAARWLCAHGGTIQEIPVDSKLFVRQINSEHRIVWRGQGRIDLADIVGGGNGLGTGLRGSCLDPETGHWVQDSGVGRMATINIQGWAEASYSAVSSTPLIDGVFVPNGQTGPQVVSSAGHSLAQMPATTGRYWGGVIHSDGNILGQTLVLDNTVYGTSERSALFMHTNAGITFDLAAIRELLPGRAITEFTSVYGMPKRDSNPSADFWVLVDGQVQFHREGVQSSQSGMLRIPLSGTSRYLTLAVSENKDRSPVEGRPPTFDTWCVFGTPNLTLN